MILLADPEVKDGLLVRDLLLEKVMERGTAMAASFSSSRPTRLASDMMVSQQADIDYLKQKGFENYDGMYVMQRTLADPVPEQALPAELTLRYWKIAFAIFQ